MKGATQQAMLLKAKAGLLQILLNLRLAGYIFYDLPKNKMPRIMRGILLKYRFSYCTTLNSTLLFSALPAAVLLSATGLSIPWPVADRISVEIPFFTR